MDQESSAYRRRFQCLANSLKPEHSVRSCFLTESVLCRRLVSTQQTEVCPVMAALSARFSHTWLTWPGSATKTSQLASGSTDPCFRTTLWFTCQGSDGFLQEDWDTSWISCSFVHFLKRVPEKKRMKQDCDVMGFDGVFSTRHLSHHVPRLAEQHAAVSTLLEFLTGSNGLCFSAMC